MKILIAAGGGGHFTPALSVITALPKDWEALIVGRKYAFEGDSSESLEYRTAKEGNIPFAAITTGRLQRKLTKHTIPSLIKLPLGFVQAVNILKKYKPDVVLSFGGYISLPVVFAAAFQKIPIVLHEQTLEAGLANKIASRFAKKICVSWESSLAYFPKSKTVVTGNPLKREKGDVSDILHFSANDKKLPLLFVTGGSGGSHAINLLIEESLEDLLSSLRVVHLTGDAQEFGDYSRLEKKRLALPEELGNRYVVIKFLSHEKFSGVVAESDIIVSRAGMGTVTEFMYYGKPALFIPLPHSQNNEQMKNALFMQSYGLATVCDQKTLTGKLLSDKIMTMLKEKGHYLKRKDEAQKAAHIDGVEQIITLLKEVVKKSAYERL